ncbi:C-type lectin domain family 4 member E-like isoform X1 [Hypomesus transpacificus]|uniref:C-type lectin domain family 4 member E-like isoform X1 n=1 Tax=Hypomesus transpacificus TaxID=137520 RepID=UPI001F07EC51|nr:C-type lectin domain family 4 member E-like isoform X1 [Hypomesus transpacificus]
MGKEENLYANVKGVSHNQGQRSPDNALLWSRLTDRHMAVSERRTYKAAAVCLGLLCVLLLAGVIGVGLFHVYCCPNGWKKLNCSCYYVSTKRKNWTDSRQDCRDREADLVIINSPEEQVFLNNLKKRVWIGLTDTVTEGTFIWVDGTPLTTLKYWLGSQPDNHSKPGSDGEDCAEIYYSPSDVPPPKTWNDYTCDSDNFWVCEKRI